MMLAIIAIAIMAAAATAVVLLSSGSQSW